MRLYCLINREMLYTVYKLFHFLNQQGNAINVRISAVPDSAVVTHITANTPVKVRGQQNKACEIFWGKDQHGFVPCNLLGDKPLTLAEVAHGDFVDGKADLPQYSPPRAFWIAPSMDALFSAGKHFQRTLLSPQQLAIESRDNRISNSSWDWPPPRLIRYPVPEFEAMKALLAKGIVAGADRDPPLLTCQQMQQAKNKEGVIEYPNRENYPNTIPIVSDCLPEDLPRIRPSFFKSSRELAPGSSDIEKLGAHFGITERGKVIGSPKWGHDYDEMRYMGAWDIGEYELTLEKPLIEHVIGRTGLVGAYKWAPQIRVTPFGPEECCVGELRNKRMGKELMAGYPKVKDALMWFQSEKALPFKKAKISSRTENIPASKENADKERTERVVIYEIDLNSDGIPDFVQWDIFISH